MSVPLPPRRFGYWTAHFVVLASMIGAGILTTSGYTLQATGNAAALLALWFVGGLMALAGAVTVSEMATALPQAGGDYIYVRQAFGRGAGVVAGWATFVIGFAGPVAVIALLAVKYLTSPFAEQLNTHLPAWAAHYSTQLGTTVLIGVVTLMHCLGQRESGWFQALTTLLKIALLLAIGVGGVLFGNGSWKHLSPVDWPQSSHWPALATGLIYVNYAYAGWNGAGYLAGEVREPSRLLPRAMIGGTLSVMVIYLLTNLAYVYAINPADMTSRSFSDPAVEKIADFAISQLFGPQVATVFALLIGLSLVASVSAYILTGPRVTFAMARDGVFPAFAGRLHATRHVPTASTIVLGLLSIGLVWSGSFLELLDYTSVGLALISGIVVASIFPLRRRIASPPYRLPLYPLPPVLFLLVIGWTVTAQLIDPEKRMSVILSVTTILAGVPIAGVIARQRKRAVSQR